MVCACCNEAFLVNAPYEVFEGKTYCGDCAFKQGIIDEKRFIKNHRYFIQISGLRAAIKDGEIYLTTGEFEWDRSANKRNCREYQEWRTAVFERDNYTCQECGIRGGMLNAHHIKPYKSFIELRYDIDNGITLCEKCHKEYHRKNGK